MKTNYLLRAEDFYRFYSKINRLEDPDACWLWNACKHDRGYGHFKLFGRVEKAHRIAYANHYGEFDSSMLVCHKKDNPSCCRPSHLWLGTSKDNAQDMVQKGRCIVPDQRGEKGSKAKLTNVQAKEISVLYSQGVLQKDLAARYKVDQSQISKIVNNKIYKDV